MLTIFQAIILGLLQGVSELFPISSLGHIALLPALLHWNIDQSSDAFLSFVVLTHLATATALLIFFWRDWVRIIRDMIRSIATRDKPGTSDPAVMDVLADAEALSAPATAPDAIPPTPGQVQPG